MIKEDNWIRAQCEVPTHIYRKEYGGIEYGSEPLTKEQIQHLNRSRVEANTRGITEEELAQWKPMISPFLPTNVKELNGNRIISKGLTSYGYDVSLEPRFKVFTNVYGDTIDPLNMPTNCYHDFEGDYCIIPPNSYMLSNTVEYFNIPSDVLVVCVGKSTLARIGIGVNCTPIEPGFSGQVVIEVSNLTTLPIKIYANQGISQFLFFQGSEPCRVSYKDKSGKYQGQTGITLARV